jgi:excinuclease ABC subunit B
MKRAMGETERRRTKQVAFNEEHGIQARSVRKAVRELIDGIVAPAFRDQPEDGFSTALLSDEKALSKEFKRLEKLMLDHARNLEFEQAAAVRDQLRILKEKVLLSGA